jgi:hypothetical protein
MTRLEKTGASGDVAVVRRPDRLAEAATTAPRQPSGRARRRPRVTLWADMGVSVATNSSRSGSTAIRVSHPAQPSCPARLGHRDRRRPREAGDRWMAKRVGQPSRPSVTATKQ